MKVKPPKAIRRLRRYEKALAAWLAVTLEMSQEEIDRATDDHIRCERILKRLVIERAGFPTKGMATGVRIGDSLVLLGYSLEESDHVNPCYNLLVLPAASIPRP
jgi:hypothetical protein